MDPTADVFQAKKYTHSNAYELWDLTSHAAKNFPKSFRKDEEEGKDLRYLGISKQINSKGKQCGGGGGGSIIHKSSSSAVHNEEKFHLSAVSVLLQFRLRGSNDGFNPN